MDKTTLSVQLSVRMEACANIRAFVYDVDQGITSLFSPGDAYFTNPQANFGYFYSPLLNRAR